MTTSPIPTNGQPDEQPRDAAFWSGQVSGLKVSNVPSGALNLNVDGKDRCKVLVRCGKKPTASP